MGTISRFRHVVSANVNAMLERAEDPEKMLSALVREMEDALGEARVAAGELLGERKRFERRSGQLARQQDEWGERAEKAVAAGRDELAREALAGRHKLADEAARCELQIQAANQGIERIHRDIQRLEQRLAEARKRQAELRQTPVAGKVLSYESPADRKLAQVSARFERLESQLDQLEARVEAYDIVSPPAARAEQDDPRVEAELDALRQRVGNEPESAS